MTNRPHSVPFEQRDCIALSYPVMYYVSKVRLQSYSYNKLHNIPKQ